MPVGVISKMAECMYLGLSNESEPGRDEMQGESLGTPVRGVESDEEWAYRCRAVVFGQAQGENPRVLAKLRFPVV